MSPLFLRFTPRLSLDDSVWTIFTDKMWNPWRENLKDTPREALNWRLWFGVFGRNTFCSKPLPPTDVIGQSSA